MLVFLGGRVTQGPKVKQIKPYIDPIIPKTLPSAASTKEAEEEANKFPMRAEAVALDYPRSKSVVLACIYIYICI